MAEAGWRQEDIDQLEAEVELARRKAEAQSFAEGDTLSRQQDRIRRAEKEARDVAHDRHHRRLEDAMKEINALTAFKAENPEDHYGVNVREKAMAAVGPAGHKHLQKQNKS
jgi:signal transduction histidine kinase